jgi:dihydroorotate dehydrogenase subfamily 1
VAEPFFSDAHRLGKKEVEGRFVIPSGIRCTHASTIARCFATIPSIGVITTKSISMTPRVGCREPIYACYAPGSYINAVGLANPGAEVFLAEFEGVEIPGNKFLLISLFGSTVADFVAAAKTLSPIADGFELNLSCPHAKGYGIEIGEDLGLAVAIIRAVADLTTVPVFVKLSASLRSLVATAQAAIQAGASGITVTNTIGPAMAAVGDTAILHNRFGGLSGDAIRPLGLAAVHKVRGAVGLSPIVIGMGGISSAEHVSQYRSAGANLFGVGSALTGMDSTAMRTYFEELQREITGGPSSSRPAPVYSLPQVPMSYSASRIVSRTHLSQRLFKIELNQLPDAYPAGELAGKFFFLCVPGVGEKPFAVFSAAEKSFIIRTVGLFTRYLETAPLQTQVLLRGPYGASLPRFKKRSLVLVGGGTGIASLLEVAKAYQAANDIYFLLGARSRGEFFDLEQFSSIGTLLLSTDDGSLGHCGFVSDLLRTAVGSHFHAIKDRLEFFNCGPGPMVESCFNAEREVVSADHIWGAIEYITSCGVGICGKCACPSGRLTCVDGPFMLCEQFIP